uniref:Uncharacterized protein n=1 Tax=Aegilops tauschii subsp. strangulata TaxID=200361 RepID=A0A452ZBA5_AEGTS
SRATSPVQDPFQARRPILEGTLWQPRWFVQTGTDYHLMKTELKYVATSYQVSMLRIDCYREI